MAVEKNVWIKACPLLPHFFKFCPTTPPCSFCCLISLNEWLIEPHSISYVLLYYIMDLHMSSLDRLLPQRLCSLFYGTRCHVYWVLTHDMFFWGVFYYSLISHTQMKTSTHREANTLTHLYKYMLTPSIMCSKQLHVLNWMNKLLLSKIYITEFHNVFAFPNY